MGVKNLWRLLLPVGHRLSIETLSHQTLAIDASIWLTQISKACRDPETGRALPNKPHVRIFLLRLMKLLYHQIKPVVVFDGKYIQSFAIVFMYSHILLLSHVLSWSAIDHCNIMQGLCRQ